MNNDFECYVQSLGGVWINGVIKDDGIYVYWQKRTKIINGQMIKYDINGDVLSSVPREKGTYDEHMVLAGIVPVDGSFLKVCSSDRLMDFVKAIMGHVCRMIACGYGDDCSDVISWYHNIDDRMFLSGSDYVFVCDSGEFSELKGRKCTVDFRDDKYIVVIGVNDGEYEVDITDSNMFVDFVISTQPV